MIAAAPCMLQTPCDKQSLGDPRDFQPRDAIPVQRLCAKLALSW